MVGSVSCEVLRLSHLKKSSRRCFEVHTILAHVKTPQPPTLWRSSSLGPLCTTARPWSVDTCFDILTCFDRKLETLKGKLEDNSCEEFCSWNGKKEKATRRRHQMTGDGNVWDIVRHAVKEMIRIAQNIWSCGARSRGTLVAAWPSGSDSSKKSKKSWPSDPSTNSKKSWLFDPSTNSKKSWLSDPSTNSKKSWLSLGNGPRSELEEGCQKWIKMGQAFWFGDKIYTYFM